jgi:hypothetical protein
MWHNDMKDFMIVETSLIEDNYDFIEKAIFLNNWNYIMIRFLHGKI